MSHDHVAEIFETMEYGPAPESDQARAGVARAARAARSATSSAARWTEAGRDASTSINPATGKPLARVAQGTAADVDAAVAAARSGAAGLAGARRPRARALPLRARARRCRSTRACFAVLETLDNGKPIRETRDIDIPLVARHFYHHAGWAQLLETRVRRATRPVGVVGQIIPWNFPLLMLAWKIAPALAAGNTVVLKPAEFTPLTALRFAEICARGRAAAGRGQHRHRRRRDRRGARRAPRRRQDRVHRLDRSRAASSARRRRAPARSSRSSWAASRPFIVFDDADLDSVVEGVVDAIWFNQGQVCCAGSRLLVQEGVAERLIEKLRARMETLRVGDPLDKAVDMGAIVAPVQLERIQRLVEQGVDEGATMWQPSWALPDARAASIPPTLFTDVAPVGHDRAGRDLRPGAGGDDVPHAGRGGRARQQHAATASPRACGPRTSTSRSTSRRRSRRASSGSTARTCSTRRRASAAIARAASGARAGARGCAST